MARRAFPEFVKSYVGRHRLWSDEMLEAAERALSLIKEKSIEHVRLSFADQHGILRGKTVVATEIESFLLSGCTITSSLLLKDTSHRTVFPIWSNMPDPVTGLRGASDMVMIADPRTFRVLSWNDKTAWFLCDLYSADGKPVPLSTRQLAHEANQKLASRGLTFIGGLEVELHVFKLEDAHLTPDLSTQPGPPPSISLLSHGYQYLTEQRMDQLAPVMDLIHETCVGMNLPIRSLEVEFGPSQIELTFGPVEGIGIADNMVLLRSAIKQSCRRHGYHATFMCRPQLQNIFSSGWHMHQSLIESDSGRNAFATHADNRELSDTGKQFAAGLLEHARDSCLFTTPTVTGYKRYRPYSLAPTGIAWGRDNRAAMLRVIETDDSEAVRIENRIGDPAANPYLYLTSQIISGLDGLKNALVPPEFTEAPYETDIAQLPQSLIEALAAFRTSAFYRSSLGDDFVNYYCSIKQAEVDRFFSEVTDWEQREYFDLF